MTLPETRQCWYRPYTGPWKDQWIGGLFHQWGTEAGAVEGDGNYSIGLVEDGQSHAVVTPTPERIHFGDPTP